MPGLWRKLDHERSRRRDAANKPDYRENFWWSSASQNAVASRTGLEDFGLKLTSRGIERTKRWYTNLALEWKDHLKKELRRITNRHPILIDGKKYAFKWELQTFLRENQLPSSSSKSDFDAIKNKASERRDILETAIDRATLKVSTKMDDETGKEYERFELSIGINRISKIYEFPEEFDLEGELYRAENRG